MRYIVRLFFIVNTITSVAYPDEDLAVRVIEELKL